MATPKAQRIGIWIITIVLGLGTLGSFVVMGLSMQNQKIDQATQQKDYAEQMKQYQEQQKVAAQENATKSEALEGYSAAVFDAASVTTLQVETLVEGDGAAVKATDTIKASYFGWTSDGKIFDSSKKKDTADAPISFSLSGVIKGWTEGLTGVKVGSVVKLTIPSDKAYGETGSGTIPANSPLVFIVKVDSIEAAKS